MRGLAMNVKVRMGGCDFAASFLIELSGLISIMMATSWQLVPEWEKTLLLFSVLVEFCGALLAFWAYEDIKKINELWKNAFKPQEQRGKE